MPQFFSEFVLPNSMCTSDHHQWWSHAYRKVNVEEVNVEEVNKITSDPIEHWGYDMTWLCLSTYSSIHAGSHVTGVGFVTGTRLCSRVCSGPDSFFQRISEPAWQVGSLARWRFWIMVKMLSNMFHYLVLLQACKFNISSLCYVISPIPVFTNTSTLTLSVWFFSGST